MDSALTNAAGMMNELARMKRLVHLLAAEGRLREKENQPAEAARSYVDALRYGNGMSRGGFLITRLVGIACEAIGYAPLAKLAPKLNPDEARAVPRDLEKLDAGHVTWAEVKQSERRFMRYQMRKYLSYVPEDPFSGQPLVYRAQGTNWLLYSVGPDGVDDGGKPVGRGLGGKGDLYFDSPW
jgi:hypothetical protein